MNNSEDGNDSAFRRTQRMQIMSGLTPTYTPGEFVFLSNPMPGFADGTRFKVVAARGIGTGQFRYELQANGQTIWVLEADLRTTPPDHTFDTANPVTDETFSVTQRMQTMTLTQRMAALGLDTDDKDSSTTQRLKILDAEKLAQAAPEINGPVTGGSFALGTGAHPPASTAPASAPASPAATTGKPGDKKP